MKLKNLVFCAVMSAAAIVLMLAVRVPFGFLTYDPKDVAVVMAGFVLGPMYALLTSLVVATVELVTISDTGLIGFFMNFIASAAFALSAAIVYKRIHTRKGAIIALLVGTVTMTVCMLLWNYIATPIYMGVSRDVVVGMLVPVFLPFNFFKGVVNSVVTLLIYKPIVRALRKTKLI